MHAIKFHHLFVQSVLICFPWTWWCARGSGICGPQGSGVEKHPHVPLTCSQVQKLIFIVLQNCLVWKRTSRSPSPTINLALSHQVPSLRKAIVFFPGYTILDLQVKTPFNNLPLHSCALSIPFPSRDLRIKHLDTWVLAFSVCPAERKSLPVLVLFLKPGWTSPALLPGSSWKQNNVDFVSLWAGFSCCLTGVWAQLFDSTDFLTWEPFPTIHHISTSFCSGGRI